MATHESRKRKPPVAKDFAAAAAARDVISSDDDRRLAQLAIDEAVKSQPEMNGLIPKLAR